MFERPLQLHPYHCVQGGTRCPSRGQLVGAEKEGGWGASRLRGGDSPTPTIPPCLEGRDQRSGGGPLPGVVPILGIWLWERLPRPAAPDSAGSHSFLWRYMTPAARCTQIAGPRLAPATHTHFSPWGLEPLRNYRCPWRGHSLVDELLEANLGNKGPRDTHSCPCPSPHSARHCGHPGNQTDISCPQKPPTPIPAGEEGAQQEVRD